MTTMKSPELPLLKADLRQQTTELIAIWSGKPEHATTLQEVFDIHLYQTMVRISKALDIMLEKMIAADQEEEA